VANEGSATLAHVKHGHEEMNDLRELATRVVAAMPASPERDSPVDQELSHLRRTEGGGGKQRALLLTQLRTELEIAVAYLTLIAGGVADCLEVAAGRGNRVNGPALSFEVRPVLELAGQIDWLLDHEIDGATRVRRYVVWRLADLRVRRRFVWDYADDDTIAAVKAELDEEENGLLRDVERAGWTAQPTQTTEKGFTPAALLDEAGNREARPSYGELVHRIAASQSIYSILSISAHTERYGMIASVEADGPPSSDGKQKTKFAGIAIDTNLAIGLTVVALDRSVRLLLGWNGASIGSFHEHAQWILDRTGLGDSPGSKR
jgi:hypothetical protein